MEQSEPQLLAGQKSIENFYQKNQRIKLITFYQIFMRQYICIPPPPHMDYSFKNTSTCITKLYVLAQYMNNMCLMF